MAGTVTVVAPVLKIVRGGLCSGVVAGNLVRATVLACPSVPSRADVLTKVVVRVVSGTAAAVGVTASAIVVVIVVVVVVVVLAVVVAGATVVVTLVVVSAADVTFCAVVDDDVVAAAAAVVVVVGIVVVVVVVVVVGAVVVVVVAVVGVGVVVVVVGHEAVAQLFVCTAPPLNEHPAPPLLAALVIAYVRECWPPPQLAEHSE